MKEKPIIFPQTMVKAILDGRKTQTRRVIKPQPHDVDEIERITNTSGVNWYFQTKSYSMLCDGTRVGGYLVKAKCEAGDILWVREMWRPTGVQASPYAYSADEQYIRLMGESGRVLALYYNYKPSICMPRVAARIFLEVKDVRIERVQDISEADAMAEGAEKMKMEDIGYWTYTRGYKSIWDSQNVRIGYGWQSNPYVWVYNFERVER